MLHRSFERFREAIRQFNVDPAKAEVPGWSEVRDTFERVLGFVECITPEKSAGVYVTGGYELYCIELGTLRYNLDK